MANNGGLEGDGWELRNEFAAVDIELDSSANSRRLKITDLETGAAVFLDAFILRSLVYLTGSEFEKMLKFPEE